MPPESLTPAAMLADATPVVQLIMVGLILAALAVLAATALGLTRPVRRPSCANLTGIIARAAPLFGALGAAWGLTNSFVGMANFNVSNLAVVAPGFAEALLSLVLGFLAGSLAVVAENILRVRASAN